MGMIKTIWCTARLLGLVILVSAVADHVPVRLCSGETVECDAPTREVNDFGPGTTPSGTASLPGGLDPMDVVREVSRYRSSAMAPTQERDVRPMPVASANGVGLPLQIGEGGPAPGPVDKDQQYPSVAFGGANYLVVWEDGRSGRDIFGARIFGARVSNEGEILDPGGIGIVVETSTARNPGVAFDGADYLVVWQDNRNGLYDIYGARVSVEGVVLDTSGIAISSAANSQGCPAVACDGTECLAVWGDGRRNPSDKYDIYGSRVSRSGAALDTAGIAVCGAAGTQTYPSVAFNGTDYLVTWTDYRNGTAPDIYGTRVSSEGTVLDTAGIAVSTAVESQSYPATACGGAGCLVTWQDLRSRSLGVGDTTDVYAARVSSSGTVLDTAGIPVSTAASAQFSVGAGFDGVNYLVVWQDVRSGSNDIYCSRVSVEGSALDTAGVIVSSSPRGQGLPSVAFGNSEYFVTWNDYRNMQWDIYGVRVSTAPAPLDTSGVAVSVIGTDQYDVAVGFDGASYLVLWVDEGHGLWDIYGARVGADGALLDPGVIAVSTAPGIQLAPAVAFSGNDYVVVWEDWRNASRDIYGTRVSVDGVVLDTAGTIISAAADDQRAPAIAFDKTGYPNCLVVWEDWRNGSWDIYGTRVAVDGSVLDTAGVVISAAQGDQRSPALAFSVANYLVAWEDNRNGSWDIDGVLLTRDGVPTDSGSISISTAANYQFSPHVAFGGTNYFVVWADERTGGPFDIYGARVSVTGSLLDPQGRAISTAPNHQVSPAVLFDGADYIVVWEDGRGGAYDIYGARVVPDGNVLDAEGLVIASSPGDQFSPAVANGPVCSALIAYSSYTQPLYRSYRVWGNVWSGPTAVLFTSAVADGRGERVSLAWEVAEDAPPSSFRIERTDSRDGDYSRRELCIEQVSPRSYSCVDADVEAGKTYWYMIVVQGAAGLVERYGPLEVEVTPPAVVWALHQSRPNPFNPRCAIGYDIEEAGPARVRVFDVAGRVVRTLADGWREPGVYRITWDGTGDSGKELASGVYFCVLEAGRFKAVRKMVISK